MVGSLRIGSTLLIDYVIISCCEECIQTVEVKCPIYQKWHHIIQVVCLDKVAANVHH
jgi:hypothetical protein